MNNTVLNVSCRSRPTRIAFLVDPSGHDATELLDRIFVWCMSCWGGRFHGVFPVVDGNVPEEWWKALVALDPDEIITFASLANKSSEMIEGVILPLRMQALSLEQRQRFLEHPHFGYVDLNVVGVNTVPRRMWSERTPLRRPRFVLIASNSPFAEMDRCVFRNFGVLPSDIGTKSACEDLPKTEIGANGATLAGVLDRLDGLEHEAVLPIDLCSHAASCPYVPQSFGSLGGFHLVIGDSPYDAMYYWNTSLLTSPYHGRSAFWLPASFIDDAALWDRVGRWIQRTSWGFQELGEGVIASLSVNQESLERIIGRVIRATGQIFRARSLAIQDFKFPPVQAPPLPSQQTFGFSGRHTINTFAVTQRVPVTDDGAIVDPPVPSVLHRNDSHKAWMVDLQLQFHPDRYSYTNVRPDWTLPKRRRLPPLFLPRQSGRIVVGGLPSVRVLTESPTVSLQIPNDTAVFRAMILRKRDTGLMDENRFEDMWTSDDGAMLRGMLRLFGSLFHCGSLFAETYWRRVLSKMAQQGERGRQHLTLKEFEQCFGQMRKKDCNENIETNYWDIRKKFRNEFVFHLFCGMVSDTVLRQGTELRCRQCGTRNWYSVDAFRSQMTCSTCGEAVRMPIEATWSYRLNDLVAKALRSKDSGVLTVIQALYQLERECVAHGLFLALPSQNLSERWEGEVVTDLDIVAIVAGRFTIGEVKSSPTGFQKGEVNKFVNIVREIKPDDAVFAASGADWPIDIEQNIDDAIQELAGVGIRGRKLKLEWQ